MSNNIYDILKKMQGLESPKSTLTEGKKAKPDYIDIDKDGDKKEPMKKAVKDKSKGAIAEAVAKVENQLNEKYMGFKKTVSSIKKGGSAKDPEAVAAAIGRKKYGKEKFQKAAAAGKKLGEGSLEDVVNKASDIVVKQLPGGQEEIDRRKKYDAEFKKSKETGTEVPAMYSGFAGKNKMKEGEYNEDMLSPAQKKFAALAEPKDKITYADKIAGAKKGKKTEGNKFSGNLMKARAQGLKKADLDGDGEMEPVHEDMPVAFSPDERATRQQAADISKSLSDKKSAEQTKQRIEKQYDADRSSREKLAKIGQLEKYKIGMPPEDVDYMVQQHEKKKNMREGWDEMQKYLDKKKGPESKGGAGKKAGTRYGGSAQTDEPDTDNETGQIAKKGRGRPKKDKFAR